MDKRYKACNMDCFNCVHPDCINCAGPTKEEVALLKEVLGETRSRTESAKGVN